MASCWLFLNPLLVATVAATTTHVIQKTSFSINLKTRVSTAQANPSYLGVNIDSSSLFEGIRGLQHHRLDFSDTSLIQLASRFCRSTPDGAILRIGGSEADDLAFLEVGSSAVDYPEQSIHVDAAYWDQIIAFADHTGCKIVWDVNANSMRNIDGSWNHTNAQVFLNHVAHAGQTLYGVQLGNEPGHWYTRNPGMPWATQLGKDFVTFKAMLSATFGSKAPKLFGPDVCSGLMTNTSPCSNMTYFLDFLSQAADVLDGVTVHHYGLHIKRDCHLDHFLDPEVVFDYQLEQLVAWKSAQQKLAPHASMILGETATCGDGGCPGLSNSFVAGFFWVHRLGRTAAIGYDMVFRQDLVGWGGIGSPSSYALAGFGWSGGNDSIPLRPNPDFFTSLLHKKVVSNIALDIKYSHFWPKTLSIHSACTVPSDSHCCGDVTLLFANLASDAVMVAANATSTNFDLSDRTEYILSAKNGNLTTQSIWLNDASEAMQPLDPLTGKVVKGRPLELPGYSYGFIVLAGAPAHDACGCQEKLFV